MNAADFLTVTMLALSALQIVIVAIHRPGRQALWVAVNLAVLVVGLGLLQVSSLWAVIAVASLFVPFVLAPALLGYFAQRRSNMSRAADAAWYATWAARLHPSGSAIFSARLYRALAEPEPEDCIAALEHLRNGASAQQKNIVDVLIATRRNDWEAICAMAANASADRSIRVMEVRALGETGRTEAMVQAFQAYRAGFVGYDLLFAQLFVVAFTGRTRATDLLVSGPLSSLDAETKSYWRSVAHYYASDGVERSSDGLAALSETAEKPSTRAAARRHLAADDPYGTWLGLSEKSRGDVEATETRIKAEAPSAKFSPMRMRATLGLIALLALMFAIELWAGGSENTETLVRLGGLWPPYVTDQGEWWRLLTAIVLHAGWLHFAANVFVLFVLGRIVEMAHGPLRVLAGFFCGGVFSSAAVLAAMEWGLTEQAILIGASGGIFTLFGIEVATQVVKWQRTHDLLDRRRVILLCAIMLLQLTIDVSMPEISLTAHLSGFAAGIVLGLLFALRIPRPINQMD